MIKDKKEAVADIMNQMGTAHDDENYNLWGTLYILDKSDQAQNYLRSLLKKELLKKDPKELKKFKEELISEQYLYEELTDDYDIIEKHTKATKILYKRKK